VRFHRLRRDLSDARFLLEAREALARGEIVGLNLDWRQARGALVTVLGRRMPLAGGALWLARTTGARLVPVTRRWLGATGGVEVTFHEPLPEPRASREDAPLFERELADAAGAFFDGHLRREPGTLRLPRLRYYSEAPRA
jgi:lauroyl/myristoyl acyltransferase